MGCLQRCGDKTAKLVVIGVKLGHGRGPPLKLVMALAVTLLWQSGPSQTAATAAVSAQMHYARALTLPAGAAGEACAVLDAEALAHAASRSGDDLRVFRNTPGATEMETPFTLGESEVQPDEVAMAPASHVEAREGLLRFDLTMPQRPYTTVDLHLAAKDYVGIATVEGVPGAGQREPMGSFAIFDSSAQGLGGSTVLPLQESSYPVLHVELRMWKPNKAMFNGMVAATVLGASVPPSREAQTIYTTVAQSEQLAQVRQQTVATLHVPAHVPVERITFVLDKSFDKNFLRTVTIAARPDGTTDTAMVETLSGKISTVHLPLYMDARPEAAIFRSLTLDAVLAASLRTGATIEIAVDNGSDAPLPIRAVRLEMRQRTVCFEAESGSTYTLRYGDAALRAPVYIASARANPVEAKPVVALLGPEVVNAGYQAQNAGRTYGDRHPELWWIVLIAVVAAIGSSALHGAKHKGRKG